MRSPRSHGSGRFDLEDLGHLGQGVVFEEGVLVFHPENVEISDRVYVGHQAILKGYFKNKMVIGSDCWIGQRCFFHSAGGIHIEEDVGIGPGVQILTSLHDDPGRDHPIMDGALRLAPVHIGAGSDIGVGAILLPGVTLGRGVQVGAGSIVTRNVPDFAIVAGNPARVLRIRE